MNKDFSPVLLCEMCNFLVFIGNTSGVLQLKLTETRVGVDAVTAQVFN